MATVISGYQYRDTAKYIDLGTYTAPGVGDYEIGMSGCADVVFQYTVASIDTTVVVRAEGSVDGSSWFNLDFDEQDITQTANGTYALEYKGRVGFVRFRFVSETGGTAATIAVIAYVGKAA